jgi:hypothetical protein
MEPSKLNPTTYPNVANCTRALFLDRMMGSLVNEWFIWKIVDHIRSKNGHPCLPPSLWKGLFIKDYFLVILRQFRARNGGIHVRLLLRHGLIGGRGDAGGGGGGMGKRYATSSELNDGKYFGLLRVVYGAENTIVKLQMTLQRLLITFLGACCLERGFREV